MSFEHNQVSKPPSVNAEMRPGKIAFIAETLSGTVKSLGYSVLRGFYEKSLERKYNRLVRASHYIRMSDKPLQFSDREGPGTFHYTTAESGGRAWITTRPSQPETGMTTVTEVNASSLLGLRVTQVIFEHSSLTELNGPESSNGQLSEACRIITNTTGRVNAIMAAETSYYQSIHF